MILFQAHKLKQKGYGSKSSLYQVNAIGFNQYDKNLLYSMGSDGELIFWDTAKKNKRKTYKFNDQNLTAGDISMDGTAFVYATGYDWHQGTQGVTSYKSRS